MSRLSSAALGEEFFARSVHQVARELVGCTLLVDGVGGVIVETEAYEAADPACHAYVGRTARNGVLFGPPAHAYVYLSYGIHSLLNAVCAPEGEAAAVLIRALEPTDGIEQMMHRRGGKQLWELCSGPGKLTEALEVGLGLNGASLLKAPFRLHPPVHPEAIEVVAGPRIGITKAVELPWRYCAARNRHVSRPRPIAA